MSTALTIAFGLLAVFWTHTAITDFINKSDLRLVVRALCIAMLCVIFAALTVAQ